MPELTVSTGQPSVDAAIRAVVGLFEAAFPGRVRGVYVEGSYADESAVSTSDVDLIVLFKESFLDDAEHERARAVATHCAALSALELDFDVMDEAQVMGGAHPMLKLGSRLLWGEDVRERVPLMPIEEWTRQRMHAAFWLMVNLYNRPRVVEAPLHYPYPSDEFLGYTRRTVQLPDGSDVPSTRNLIRTTGWAATALIALKTGQYVVRKRDCYSTYREQIRDEWTDLLETIYEKCRREWNYLIPEAAGARQTLRAICERTLAFENHFLREYQRFLLDELQSGDEKAVRPALHILGHTFFADEQVIRALHDISHPHSILGGAAYGVLDHYYISPFNLVEDEADDSE